MHGGCDVLAASAATAATDVAVVLVVDNNQFGLGLDHVLRQRQLVVVAVVVLVIVAGRVLQQIVVVVVHAAGGYDLFLRHLGTAVLLLYQVLDVERQVVRGHRVRGGSGCVLVVRQRLGRSAHGHGIPSGHLELGIHREVVVVVVRTGQRLLLLLQQRLNVLLVLCGEHITKNIRQTITQVIIFLIKVTCTI